RRRAARRRAAAAGPRGRGGVRLDPRGRRPQRAGAAPARSALRSGRRRPACRARRANSRVPPERRRRGALPPASLSTLVRAGLVAIGATLVAALLVLMGGAAVTALDWSVYDRWLRSRAPVADTPRLVVIARDAASDARFGAGAWDRAVLARMVTALGRGGAAVVALDVALGTPSAPGRGGAASDALLAQAAQTVDVISIVLPSTPRSAVPAERVGHSVVEPDVDGVVRAVPLWLPFGERARPALGLALPSPLAARSAAPPRGPVARPGPQ